MNLNKLFRHNNNQFTKQQSIHKVKDKNNKLKKKRSNWIENAKTKKMQINPKI